MKAYRWCLILLAAALIACLPAATLAADAAEAVINAPAGRSAEAPSAEPWPTPAAEADGDGADAGKTAHAAGDISGAAADSPLWLVGGLALFAGLEFFLRRVLGRRRYQGRQPDAFDPPKPDKPEG